jgi:flavin-dependent dehydrogenase
VGSNPTLSAIYIAMKNRDIIIVGGGPAGATLGHFLKENNVDSLIIERSGHNRNKICAGGLPIGTSKILPDTLISFKRIEYDKFTISYKGTFTKSSTKRKTFMYGVMRREFDEFLRTGLDVHYNEKFESFEKDKDGIIVKTNKDIYRAKFLIGADGVGSRVSILSGLAPKKRFILAEEKEVPYKKPVDKKEIKIYLGYNFLGYGWAFPKEKVNSVGAGNLQKYFKKGVSNAISSGGETKIYPISLWGGKETLTKGRIALIGEAGNLVDPFTAGGIYHAVFSANILSKVILESLRNGKTDLLKYNEFLEKILYPELEYSLILSKMFYPFIHVIKNYIVKESTINLAMELASRGYVSYEEFYRRVKNSKHFFVKAAYFLVKKFAK